MKNIKKDIRKSNTLPSNFYCSELLFSRSIDKLFVNSWQLVTHDSVVSKDNQVYPFILIDNILPEPLFLINEDNQIKCYSNVCTHRGNLLIDSPSILKHEIVCSYHGRRFDNRGNFISMPETKGMINFPCEGDNLTQVSCQRWNQFIFTSLDPKFQFKDLINDINKRVSWMPINDFVYREDLSQEYMIEANWALYCDNYLEGFHIPFIHKDLNAVLDYKNYDVETFKYSNLQIGYAENKDICFDLPEDSPEYGENIAAYYFWLFPNIMLNFYPWGLSVNIITPISVDKTRVEFKSYVWKEELLNQGAGADVNKVELEDQEIVQKVQKGVRSRLYNHGRFSPKMEKGVHHFHRLVRDFMES